jgi:hypothetical protein
MVKLSEDDRRACMGQSYRPLDPDEARPHPLVRLWAFLTGKSKKSGK